MIGYTFVITPETFSIYSGNRCLKVLLSFVANALPSLFCGLAYIFSGLSTADTAVFDLYRNRGNRGLKHSLASDTVRALLYRVKYKVYLNIQLTVNVVTSL